MATQSEIAERIDLSTRQVQRLLKNGILPGPRGSAGYSLDDCTKAYINHLRSQANRSRAESDIDPERDAYDVDYERALLIQSQRRLNELKEEQIRRESAPVELIAWTLNKVGTQIVSILDAIPLKVKRRIPQLNASQIELIKREVVSAQNIAANIKVNIDEYHGELEGD